MSKGNTRWVEYQGPHGSFIYGDHTFVRGVPQEIDPEEMEALLAHPAAAGHHFAEVDKDTPAVPSTVLPTPDQGNFAEPGIREAVVASAEVPIAALEQFTAAGPAGAREDAEKEDASTGRDKRD